MSQSSTLLRGCAYYLQTDRSAQFLLLFLRSTRQTTYPAVLPLRSARQRGHQFGILHYLERLELVRTLLDVDRSKVYSLGARTCRAWRDPAMRELWHTCEFDMVLMVLALVEEVYGEPWVSAHSTPWLLGAPADGAFVGCL